MSILPDLSNTPITPEIAEKMVSNAREFLSYGTSNVLEPSAGTGELVSWFSSRCSVPNIDAVEINRELWPQLEECKHCMIVHDDFMTFETHKEYAVIVMNPPVLDAPKHLMKALTLLAPVGICCCVIQSGCLDPTSRHYDEQLVNTLKKYKVRKEKIKYKIADHKGLHFTLLSVSCNYETFPVKSSIEASVDEDFSPCPDGVSAFEKLAYEFHRDVEIGRRLYREFRGLFPGCEAHEYSSPTHNIRQPLVPQMSYLSFIEEMRKQYWDAAVNKNLKNAVIDDWSTYVRGLDHYYKHYDLRQVSREVLSQLFHRRVIQSLNHELENVFHVLAYGSAYADKELTSSAEHYDSWLQLEKPTARRAVRLKDKVTRVLYYNPKDRSNMEKPVSDTCKLHKMLECLTGVFKKGYKAEFEKPAWTLDDVALLPFLEVKRFKSGSLHFTFNPSVMLCYNIYIGKQHQWLFPNYGLVPYDELTRDERRIVDSFNKEGEYDLVCRNPKQYLCDLTSYSVYQPENIFVK
jgi:hypothetical protein